jgi:hypothetical protein
MPDDDFSPPFDVYHLLPPAPSYSPTKEFQELLRWWNGGTGGVCCLAGIGAAERPRCSTSSSAASEC